MTDLSTRKMASADRPDVEALLDDSIGRGFWDPTRDLDDIVLVGTKDGRLVGVASARVGSDPAATEPPVGHLRLVAVAPSARRHGVATRLVAEVTEVCRSYGARDLIAYAWVHGPGGIAPLAGALERVGYVFDRRIENFYGGAVAAPCPACRRSPCICAADLYRLDAHGADGGGERTPKDCPREDAFTICPRGSRHNGTTRSGSGRTPGTCVTRQGPVPAAQDREPASGAGCDGVPAGDPRLGRGARPSVPGRSPARRRRVDFLSRDREPLHGCTHDGGDRGSPPPPRRGELDENELSAGELLGVATGGSGRSDHPKSEGHGRDAVARRFSRVLLFEYACAGILRIS